MYFRESLAWCMALLKARPYCLASRFPVLTQTDHQPLRWIRKSSGKAAISTFLTDKVAEVDFEVHYLPGHLNRIADSVSRPPFLGPIERSVVGLTIMVKALFELLPKSYRKCKHTWATAGKDTRHVSKQLQAWREGTNPVKPTSPPPRAIRELNYDLAIAVPVA